jgi:hypothetical protein
MEGTFSDEIREAISGSGLSRYRLSAESRVDQGTLSRFMNRKGSLSMDALDRVARVLGLHVVRGTGKEK